MYASVDITQDTTVGTVRWLLLIHQIPPKPDYFRVKVRRRLHRIGAVALKNSVYVLPNNDDAMEDFQWLRKEVVDEGGEATLCSASFIEGVNDGEVESMFRAQSDTEYDEIVDAAHVAADDPTDTDIQRLTRQLAQAATRDFFGAARAQAAKHAILELDEALTLRLEQDHSPPIHVKGTSPNGATWVTRVGVHVDRIASAWLIKRFIDERALFKFVPAKGYNPEGGELRFDMFEGEYTHEGDRCTFEVLVARFEPSDVALHVIAEIVHDIDCKDDKFSREEAAGVASIIRGISLANTDDTARIEAGTALFDGLYAASSRRKA